MKKTSLALIGLFAVAMAGSFVLNSETDVPVAEGCPSLCVIKPAGQGKIGTDRLITCETGGDPAMCDYCCNERCQGYDKIVGWPTCPCTVAQVDGELGTCTT